VSSLSLFEIDCQQFTILLFYRYIINSTKWAVNSVGECFLDAEEVISSNLIRPTIKSK
jgi:hypothetical protein